jgi:hypothetical protein
MNEKRVTSKLRAPRGFKGNWHDIARCRVSKFTKCVAIFEPKESNTEVAEKRQKPQRKNAHSVLCLFSARSALGFFLSKLSLRPSV